MNNSQMIEQEKNVLRWGGLSGILGASLLILVMVFVSVVIGPDPTNLTEWVTRFPNIHMARVAENGMYLVGLLLEVPLFLALFWALRKTNLAPALFGSVMGIVGLVAMIISATPHVAHAPLSEIYHSAGATPEAQAAIAIMWQATWGVFSAPLYVGFFVMPIGLILLGVAMFGSLAFGKGLGWVSVVLGVLGLVAAVLQMVDPASPFGGISYLAGIIFYFVLGWKVYRLSKTL